jgi:hypothetical protein
MRPRSRRRSRRVGIGVGGGEGEGFTNIPSTVQSDSMHTTPPYHNILPCAPRRHWPLDPRRHLDATDGRTDDSSAQNRNSDSFPPTTSRPIVQRAAPPHLTSRYPLLSSSIRRNPARGSIAWAQKGPTACRSDHITSTNQSLNQPTNFISNVCIVISHQLIPPLLYNIVCTLRLCDVK